MACESEATQHAASHLTLVAPRKRYDAQRDGCFDRKKENCGWSVAAASGESVEVGAGATSRGLTFMMRVKMSEEV